MVFELCVDYIFDVLVLVVVYVVVCVVYVDEIVVVFDEVFECCVLCWGEYIVVDVVEYYCIEVCEDCG